MKDLYYILGTHNKATPAELNAAYTKLAEKLQPRGWEQDQFLIDHFNEITYAYQLLSDPKRRRAYDIALKNHQQRRLDRFKMSYLNVAATLTLIAFTSLFGYYVLKAVNGTKDVKVVKTVPLAAAAVAPKHHKRRHLAPAIVKAIPRRVNKPLPQQLRVNMDTTTIIKRAAVGTPFVANTSPAITKAPVDIKPVNAVPVPDNHAQEYLASIQSNVTGLVYLHQEANYTSVVLSKIPNHAQVRVLEKGQAFCKVSFDDQTGYVPNWSIPAQ
jgi:hypothetical protein